jgi:hypothetical protein
MNAMFEMRAADMKDDKRPKEDGCWDPPLSDVRLQRNQHPCAKFIMFRRPAFDWVL